MVSGGGGGGAGANGAGGGAGQTEVMGGDTNAGVAVEAYWRMPLSVTSTCGTVDGGGVRDSVMMLSRWPGGTGALGDVSGLRGRIIIGPVGIHAPTLGQYGQVQSAGGGLEVAANRNHSPLHVLQTTGLSTHFSFAGLGSGIATGGMGAVVGANALGFGTCAAVGVP